MLLSELAVDAETPELQPVFVEFCGRLQRPPYAEITDIAPLPALHCPTLISADGRTLRAHSPELDTLAEVVIEGEGAWELVGQRARWQGRGPTTIRCRIEAANAAPSPVRWPQPPVVGNDKRFVVAGAIDYVANCCALQVRGDEVCVITDHRLLPLSWTRDAYYQTLPIRLVGDDASQRLVGDHLRWLFGSAWCYDESSPAGQTGWLRSHLANGSVKDRGLQADQQLYPVLELAEYRNTFGHWPTPPRSAAIRAGEEDQWWADRVRTVLAKLPADHETGLLASAENPADDPSQFPYLFSTQVLYGHALRTMAHHGADLGLSELDERVQQIWANTREGFVTEGPFGQQFAYEADLVGEAGCTPTPTTCRPRSPRYGVLFRQRPALASHDALCLLQPQPR